MKKMFVFLPLLLMLTACSKEENDTPIPSPVEKEQGAVIEELYAVRMRRELPFPFAAYVMRLSNGEDVYMLRTRYNRDLHIGERICYQVFSFCPNEIAVIDGVELGDGSDLASQETAVTRSLVASDPTEGSVAAVFDMKIRYSLTFAPIDTRFIVLDDGNLIYVKKSKLGISLKAGDRIVYNVYTLSPNEVLAIKLLE